MARPSIAIALPRDERGPVADALREADLDPIVVQRPDELAAHLAAGRHIALAILDGESDFDTSLEYYELLREGGRDIPALMVLSARTLERVERRPRRVARRVLHPALLARVDPLAGRGDDDPAPGRRRRQRGGPPDRARQPGRLVAQRDLHRGLQPQGRRRQDDRRRQPRRGPHGHGPSRPPRGRRHGDRPHRQLARPGARPDPRRRGRSTRTRPGLAPPATLDDLLVGPPVGDARPGPGVEPPQDVAPRPGPRRRGDRHRDGAPTTSSSWTCTPTTTRSTAPSSSAPTGSSCR